MRKIFLTLLFISVAGVFVSCDDDKLVTDAGLLTVGAGNSVGFTTPNSERVKVWFKKDDYERVSTAGVIYGTKKDEDYLLTYGKVLTEDFNYQDTVTFDLYDLEANTSYYYMGIGVDIKGVTSYSGIRSFTTLKDEISCEPSFLEFKPANIALPTSDTLMLDAVVTTRYDSWDVTFDADLYPWIKEAYQVDDTTLRVVISVVEDEETALTGRTAPLTLSATSGTVVKTRSYLVNQLPVETTLSNDEDYVYSFIAAGGYSGVGSSNAGVTCTSKPDWISSVTLSSEGRIQVTADPNKSMETRTGEVVLVTDLTGEENIVLVSQVPGITLTADTLYLEYESNGRDAVDVTTYDGTNAAITYEYVDDFADYFTYAYSKNNSRITIIAKTENSNLDPIVKSVILYYGEDDEDLSEPLSKEFVVCQNSTDFTVDPETLEYPKSAGSHDVTASHAIDTVYAAYESRGPNSEFLNLSWSGDVATITTSDNNTNSERTATVSIQWGEHIATVTVTQSNEDETAEPAGGSYTVDLTVPYGSTGTVSLDINEVLDAFGISQTAYNTYFIPSSSSSMGKVSTTDKSIVWRFLNADGTPYTNSSGDYAYTGTGYGCYFDEDNNVTYRSTSIYGLNFDEDEYCFDVEIVNGNVGDTYSTTAELLYTLPSSNWECVYAVTVNVTVGKETFTEMWYELDEAFFEDGTNYVVDDINAVLADAFDLDESEITSMISSGEIAFYGYSSDGSLTTSPNYSTTGYIYDADGNVASYPNPVYITYENGTLTCGHVSGGGELDYYGDYSFIVEFLYGDLYLYVGFYW